ncbi:MAG: aminotransferase class III-fold pyridoxal phosphate-dependent enzyme, partial [Acidimicrobiales bacterium]
VPSAERVRFTSSGTEATMLALRIARAMTGRRRVAKLAGHFHGWHDQMAWGADPPFDGPDSGGLPPGGGDTVLVLPAQPAAVGAALGGGDVAALIVEPTGAAWGTVPLGRDVLAGIREAATQAGTVLIFDEVVSGFRWSPGGVQGATGIVPDLTALGKVLAGGMPGGAVAGRADLVENLALPDDDPRRVSHPGTHNAHPMAAAAGVATLELLRSGELQTGAAGTAAQLRAGLSDVLARHGVAGAVYGESSTFHLLLGVDGLPTQVEPARVKAGPGRAVAAALQCAMLLEGVHLFHGSGFVSVAHGDAETERTVRAFDRALGALRGEGLL